MARDHRNLRHISDSRVAAGVCAGVRIAVDIASEQCSRDIERSPRTVGSTSHVFHPTVHHKPSISVVRPTVPIFAVTTGSHPITFQSATVVAGDWSDAAMTEASKSSQDVSAKHAPLEEEEKPTAKTFGKLYKFYSAKVVYLPSILLFEAASALCGAAPNSTTFILGRAISGVGATGIFAGSIVCIVHNIPLNNVHRYKVF
ncbi:hypothetical protein DL768_003655 [Monosporascus sp. mg162]|nr:hypothetical protein DL768_003655 [Monosporascus sp. mg162]